MTTAFATLPVSAATPEWTSGELLARFGLPLLLVVVGLGLFVWGRRERREARARIGARGGFGGPPGTLDIGSELGFGVQGRGPDPNAGRSKILAGGVAALVGFLVMFAMIVWLLVS